jgi:hypothetical protein
MQSKFVSTPFPLPSLLNSVFTITTISTLCHETRHQHRRTWRRYSVTIQVAANCPSKASSRACSPSSPPPLKSQMLYFKSIRIVPSPFLDPHYILEYCDRAILTYIVGRLLSQLNVVQEESTLEHFVNQDCLADV